MSKILVTGGAGFIGSHTCLRLLENGHKIVVIDSFLNSSRKSLLRVNKLITENKIEIFEGDLKIQENIEHVFLKSKSQGEPIKAVIHFAGLKSVLNSIKNPLQYWDNNLVGTINLLKIMERNNCFNIVFSSSATVYNFSENNLIDEKTIINPINPYGHTKATIEEILKNIFNCQSDKWKIISLRYFNPIGAHSSGMIGEDPNGAPNNVFPFLLKVAIGKIKKLKIFGNDWPTHDGTGIRDYIHVLDLADGHVLALEYLFKNNSQILFLNLGTGVGTSVLDLINCFEKVNGINIPYEIVGRRIGDIPFLVADNTLAIKKLNWTPWRTLEDMCSDGWRWQKMNPDGYK